MSFRVLYLTRHGETAWNAEGRWQGQTDIPLNANGYRQARAIGLALRGAGVTAVVTSDLARAYETARVAADVLGISVSYVDRDLRERAFGPFEGLTRDECARGHPDAWRAWVEADRVPDGAEGRQALAARVLGAIGRAAAGLSRDDQSVLIVTHGGALRAAVAAGTGELPAPIANGAIWRVDWKGAIVAARPL
jgi:broad specificity phosphatase PhoE